MIKKQEILNKLSNGELDNSLKYIYCTTGDVSLYRNRINSVIEGYTKVFGDADEMAIFSAPGRTEIGGNHTDHQHGCVIAGSVNLDVIAAVSFNNDNIIRIQSKGYPMDEVKLDDLEVYPQEYDKAISLI